MFIMLYSCIVWSLQSGSFHQSQAFPKILSLAVVPQREDECEAVAPPSSVETTGCYRQPRSGVVWINVNYMVVALNVYTAITLCCDHSDETSALALHTPAALVFHFRNCGALRSCQMRLASQLWEALTNLWRTNLGKNTEVIETLRCQDSGSSWLFMTYMTYMTYVIMYTCIHDATWQHWTSHISIYFMHQDLVLPQWDSPRPSIQSGPPRSHEHRSRWYPK